MTDVAAAIRTHLLANTALYALVGERVYAEIDAPPVGATPAGGGVICFKVRGGGPDYSDALLYPSIQFKCYGVSRLAANAVYQALYAALQNTRAGGTVRWAQCEVLGQTLQEPETTSGAPWWFVLTYFQVYVAA
jgi:hypothetical protein